MGKALTLVDGSYAFVDESEALKSGNCCFCGFALAAHPKGRNGKILINRHHQIDDKFKPVYSLVKNGEEFPSARNNMYWAGMGCHFGYNQVFGVGGSKTITRKNAEQLIEYLIEQLKKFLAHMEPRNFGLYFLPEPAPLPDNLVHRGLR